MTRREYKLVPKPIVFLNAIGSTVIGIVGSYGSWKSTLVPLRIRTDVGIFLGGWYWDRTSGPCRVKAVLYR